MEQILPILVPRGFPESLLVRGDILPADEKKIMVFALNTPLKFVRDIAPHRYDDGLRFAQRNIELIWLTGRLTPDFKTIADFRLDPIRPDATGRFRAMKSVTFPAADCQQCVAA